MTDTKLPSTNSWCCLKYLYSSVWAFCLGEKTDARMTRNAFFSLEWKNWQNLHWNWVTQAFKWALTHTLMTPTTIKRWVEKKKNSFSGAKNEMWWFSQVCETEINFFVLNIQLHCNCVRNNLSATHNRWLTASTNKLAPQSHITPQNVHYKHVHCASPWSFTFRTVTTACF